MKSKLLFLYGLIPLSSIPVLISISCNQQKNIFVESFSYKNFTKNQLITLNNKIEFSSIFNQADSEKINKFINNLKETNEYQQIDFDTIIKQYSSSDLIHNSLLSRNRIISSLYPNQQFIPEIQLIVYEIFDNFDYYKNIYPNLINIKNIRSISYAQNTEQIFYLENLIALHLNKFNIDNKIINVELTEIKSIENNTGISFKVILNNKIIEQEFYLKGFFSYKSINKNYNFEDTQNNLRFNEYLSEIKINFTDKKFNIINFDSLVDNPKNSYNLLAFVKLLTDYSNTIKIEVPEYRKNIDKSYELIFNPNKTSLTQSMHQDYFFTIKVTKVNGKVEYFDFNSINFTNHYHLFNGYRDMDDKRYTFPYTTVISFENDINAFVRTKINQTIIDTFNKFKNNLLVFNNKKMSEIEAYELIKYMPESIKFIEFEIYREIIQYFPVTTLENYLADIKLTNLTLDKSIPGKIYFNIDLLNNQKQSLIDEETKKITFEITGFKGYKNI